MSFEVRTLTAEEVPEAEMIAGQAFGSRSRHDNTERVARAATTYSPQWYLGAFEDGEMTSMMRTLPSAMYLNGGTLDFGAVSPVANSPLHRRKGHSGAMLRRSLELMRERGQVLSGLYTPHPAFYRRYGWEIASEWRTYSFAPKDFGLSVQPAQRGRFRFLPVDAWQSLEAVYRIHAATGNGTLRRDEYWWRTYVADTPWRPGTDVVLWEDDSGSPEGYAVYQQPSKPGPGYELIDVEVRELIANSRDAYLNLWAYFGRHDIHNEVSIAAAPHEAVPAMVSDTEKLQIKQGYAVLLRVVDFEAAMRVRRPAREDATCELTIRLLDDTAPWNEGVWRAGVAEAKTWVERTQETPELTLTARMLAPLFNGYLDPEVAAATGLIEATSEDALLRAKRLFAVQQPPYFVDHF